tara:strand:- start:6256 stop:8442 length:2187 start_codon:yes stop_codon:yes gene_type:complete
MATIVEYGEDPSIKALRESIISVGQSVAGGIARNREQQNRLVMEAQKRAHETYITQMGIQSREKISREGLEAQRERNRVLDRQHEKTFGLSQKNYQLRKDVFEDEKLQREIDAEAAGGYEFMMNSYLDWKYDDKGNLAPSATADQIKVNTQLISKSPAMRAKWAQSKLALKEIKDTITARMMSINGLLKYDTGEQTAQLKAILQGAGVTMENGRVDASQLARFVHSKEMYDQLIKEGIVSAASASSIPQHVAKRQERYYAAQNGMTRPDGTNWLPAYDPRSPGQIKAMVGYETAVKGFDTIKSGHKDRKDVMDTLSEVNEGVDFASSNRKRLVSNLVYSNFKPFMQSSGFIFSNPSQINTYIESQVSATFDHLERKLKDVNPKAVTSEDVFDTLTDKDFNAELAKLGIKAIEKPLQNYQEAATHWLREILNGDIADQHGIRPSMRLFAHYVSNKQGHGLKGNHVAELLKPTDKEARKLGNIYRKGTGNVALASITQREETDNQLPTTQIDTRNADNTLQGNLEEEDDFDLGRAYRNWQDVPGMSPNFDDAITQMNAQVPVDVRLTEDEVYNLKAWYSLNQSYAKEEGDWQNRLNLDAPNGINLALREMLATQGGRATMEKLHRDTGKNQVTKFANAVRKFHELYIASAIGSDQVLGPNFMSAKKDQSMYRINWADLKNSANGTSLPENVRQRYKYYHQLLGGNDMAWQMLNNILRNNHGMSVGVNYGG